MASSANRLAPNFGAQNGSIAEMAERARQMFLCCSEIPSEEVSRITDSQFVRFTTWASDIGVFALHHASLDYRLRTSLPVRVAFKGNLENICVYLLSVLKSKLDHSDDELEKLQELGPSQIPHFGRTLLQSSVANDEMRTIGLFAVGKSISALHKLSIAITQALNKGPLATLPKLFDVDNGYQVLKERTEYTEDFRDPVKPGKYEISSAFEGYVRDVLTHRVFSSTNGIVLDDNEQRYRQALFDRCVTTICTRRRELAYFRRYQLKLSQRSATTLELIPENRDSMPNHQFSQKINLVRNTPDGAVASSTASSSIEAAFGKESPFEIPPPPKVEEGETEIACPYCCFVLPIKTFSIEPRPIAWERHLLKDLQPYMCLFPNCTLQGKTYSSFKDWIAHLHQPHFHSFVCPFHTENTHESSFNPFSFSSLLKFEVHLNTYHHDFGHLTIDEVICLAGQPTTLPQKCFICFTSLPTALTLEEHIANHVKSMLLLALPWRDDIENEKEIASDRPADSMKYDETSSVGFGEDHAHGCDADYATKEFNAKLALVDFEPMSIRTSENK